MIDYTFQPIEIKDNLKPFIRKFIRAQASVKSNFDQSFYPVGYVRLTHTLEGQASISIPDKEVVKEAIQPGPYFSGLIKGDNAYMHFTEDLDWTIAELFAGAGYYLFHLDMTDLVNTTTHFSNVSPIANKFNEEAIEAKNQREVILAYENFIEECLKNRLDSIEYLDESVAIIESKNGAISIKELFEQVNIPISERQFNRLFKKVIGLSPKHWCRVLQINYALELLESGINLTELAINAGFYDQAHFIRSFQNFLRSSPKTFIENEETDIMKHLHHNNL